MKHVPLNQQNRPKFTGSALFLQHNLLGSTHMVNQVYSAYYKLMKTISAKAWEPSKETLQDLQGAQAQTNAYRFPAKVMPHEPPPPHLETGGRS